MGSGTPYKLEYYAAIADDVTRRIKPLEKSSVSLIRVLFPLLIFALFGIFLLFTTEGENLGVWNILSWYLFISATIGYVLKTVFPKFQGREAMQRGSIRTSAIIRYKYQEKYDDGDTYHLILEFTPDSPWSGPHEIMLNAEVRESFWKKLKVNEDLNVSYAIEDPYILTIEGE